MAEQPASFQMSVYLATIFGQDVPFPLRLEEIAEAAYEVLDEGIGGYLQGGAGLERTVDANRSGFDRWRLRPRALHSDLAARHRRVDLFGRSLDSPLLMAPVGVPSCFRDEAESAILAASLEVGVPWVVPTLSARPMEELAAELGDAPRFFQLYWQQDWDVSVSLLERAEAAGYDAVMLTVDTQLPGWRPRDMSSGFHPLLSGIGSANVTSDPVFLSKRAPDADDEHIVLEAAAQMVGPRRTWDDVARLCEATSLPLVVKGISHPDDVALALQAGVRGIGVSNHGGRQVDGSLGAIECLPDVAAAVNGRVPIIFDSGVRSGADIVKAVALGADAVMIGRPYIWGLSIGGTEGVAHVLRCLLADLDITLALLGATTLADLEPSLLVTRASAMP